MSMMVTLEDKISRPLLTGVKTITSTPQALYVGSERRKRRNQMIVYNESNYDIYYGDETVTTGTGMILPAGEIISFNFYKNNTVDIYFVSPVNVDVRVVES